MSYNNLMSLNDKPCTAKILFTSTYISWTVSFHDNWKQIQKQTRVFHFTNFDMFFTNTFQATLQQILVILYNNLNVVIILNY